FNLFARVSPLQLRDRQVGVQAPLSALAEWKPLRGGVGLLAVMIGTVTFDGASNGELWASIVKALAPSSVNAAGVSDSVLLAGAGMSACVLIVLAFYALGISGVKSVAHAKQSETDLSRAFAHSLAPIAAAYAIAHYLNFLLFQGTDMLRVISDPLGSGSNYLGTANTYYESLVIPSNTFWYVQIGIVIAGHVAALVLAHDRALALFGNAREAIRSQYYLLVVMIGFTSLALWLLSESNR
ncbi:MAG: fenitrothion hydrolase, partial [Solirubrobacterales bacterium]